MTAPADTAWLVPIVAAALAVALAGWILTRWWAERFHSILAVVLLLTAAVEVADGSPPPPLRRRARLPPVGLAAEFLRMAGLFALLAALIGRSGGEGAAVAR